ncbi:S-adenosyl-L-methionine-dependent methyltransferase [Phaeosphaeriaceae sp. PMI808]|nr:S-adenosyl-L-methionine-dependent methyltransferase [Phaeosphaeriaceae sp. PMI808]
MLASGEAQSFGRSDFWDERYAKGDGDTPTHEWLRDFDALEPFFKKYLSEGKGEEGKFGRLLHLGSGDSTIPYDLLDRGYKNQLCIDFSTVVVDLMKSRHASEPEVEWIVGDLRNMAEIKTNSIDVAFDKSTLDAMIYGSPWNPPEEVLKNTGEYINEVWRVLKDDGIFLCITFRQPHFIKPILNQTLRWDMRVEIIGDQDSFSYFGFVLTKRK